MKHIVDSIDGQLNYPFGGLRTCFGDLFQLNGLFDEYYHK